MTLFKNQNINRTLLNEVLFKELDQIRGGIILDVGSENTPYKNKIRYDNYHTLEIEHTICEICGEDVEHDDLLDILENCEVCDCSVTKQIKAEYIKKQKVKQRLTKVVKEMEKSDNPQYSVIIGRLNIIIKELEE